MGGRTSGEDDDVGFHRRAVFEDDEVLCEVRDLGVLEVDLSSARVSNQDV